MRRALGACLGLLVAAVVVQPSAWALERELAGVRLGTRALTLLNRPGFGQPDFIGPLGTIGTTVAAAASGQASRAGGAGARGGARGGAGMRGGGARGGMRGGGARGGMRGGGARGGMRGGAGMRGATGPSLQVDLTQMRGGMRGGGARGGTRGGGATGARGPGGGAQQDIYWLYRRAGGATLVLTLDRKGAVRAIVLTGSAPYPPGRTARHIGLGSAYTDVVRAYGYPDQSATLGTSLETTYVDQGVRFRLDGMRVTQITIGTYVPTSLPTAPTAAPQPEVPGPGLSIDELKGYM